MLTVSIGGALRLGAIASLMWAGPVFLIGPGQQLPAEFRLMLVGTSGAAMTALGIAGFCWGTRKALLRARLRTRITTMVAALAGIAGCAVLAWASMPN